MLKDLRISPYRKLTNIFDEVFGRYTTDYRAVMEEYNHRPAERTASFQPLPVHM